MAQHPNQQAADIDLLLTKTSDCARHQEHAECTTAYNNALKEAERTAPKYATRE
ncbi:DUF1190 domain-containing protein, partial [Escherichia coli]